MTKPILRVETTVTYSALCPHCNEYGFDYTHLRDDIIKNKRKTVHDWHCNNCGVLHTLTIDKDGNGVVTPYKGKDGSVKHKTLVLLKLHKPLSDGKEVFIVVEGMAFSKIGKEPTLQEYEHFCNEDRCPWNYLGIHIKEGENIDPHGVFEHIETIIKPSDLDYKDFDWDEHFHLFKASGCLI